MENLWLFILLLSLATTAFCNNQLCAEQRTCGECIAASPICRWCEEASSTTFVRCQATNDSDAHCSANSTQNPRSSTTFSKNDNFSTINATQMRPQVVQAKLRIGEPLKFNITFKKLIDYPLDLYYMMDLSFSMQDDLEKLKGLGTELFQNINNNITKNVRIGFGTFVDKVMLPFATNETAWLTKTCNGALCQSPFGFHHQLPITDDQVEFQRAVNSTIISANIDAPEGGFDGLLQTAVCQDIIQWRKNALRVILFTTDAESHIALDGRLAGITEPNDMRCHLNKSGDKWIYTMSQMQDYPSVGQLKMAFSDNKIQTIFAVTENVYELYKDLTDILTDTAFVEKLKDDSSNILNVIRQSYEEIRGQFSLTSPKAPSNVDMKYRVFCPSNKTWENDVLKCNNVTFEEEVVFEFSLTAKSCPSNKQQDTLHITSNTVPDVVTIHLEYLCECDCNVAPTINSSICNSHGKLKCGQCDCDTERSGKFCECESHVNNSQCIDQKHLIIDQTPTSCHGRGNCNCGNCTCEEGFSGLYCECSETGCPEIGDQTCGGPKKGSCKNCYNKPECICNSEAGWSLNSQKTGCTCNEKLCISAPNATLCSGNGRCECDACVCTNETLWADQFCHVCVHPACNTIDGRCEGKQIKECALCVYSNSQNTDACVKSCQDVGIEFDDSRDVLPDCANCSATSSCSECNNINERLFTSQECSLVDDVDCTVKYKIVWHSSYRSYFLYIKRRNSRTDCPAPLNLLLVVLPIVGGIVVMGIIGLVIWKYLMDMYDEREYKKLQLELDAKVWTKSDNPIHIGVKTRIVNPKFEDGNDVVETNSYENI